VINARAFFEHRFRADLEGLKDCFLVPLLKLGVALDVQGPRLDELDRNRRLFPVRDPLRL